MMLASALPLRAEETQSKAYVVLVGISRYEDPQIKPRPHAETDVKALYDLFTAKKYLGVEKDHIRLLLGTQDAKRHSEPATRENILKELKWAAQSAGRNDLVVFAFIGQGGPLGDRTCYFGTDSTFKDRTKNAVAAPEIEHALEKLKSQRLCVLVDVNFKGFDAGPAGTLEPSRTNLFKEFLGSDEENVPPGRVVFLATDGFTQSIDVKDMGLFAKVVVDALKGAADKEGYEADGVVTVDELAEYLNKELPKLAKQVGKTKEEKDQQHHVLGSRSSNFVLTYDPEARPKVTDRLANLAKLATEGAISKDLAEEGATLLSRMPKLKAYQELRKTYQKLADGSLTAEQFTKDRKKVLDGMKLKRSAALAWASKVIQATQVVKEGYVKEVNQGELVAWAVRGLFRQLDEKIPPEIKDRLDKAKNLNEEDLTSLLADVRERLGQREDLENHKDIDFALQRMLSHLDPHTTYIDPETLLRFHQETQGKFTGIGIQINKNTAKDMLQVITPIKGSPAYKAGLKAGDIVTTIIREEDSNGHKLDKPEVISTKGLSTNDAVKKILGKKDTKVKLAVEREGADKPLEFEITRDTVEVETVLGNKRQDNDEWDYYIDHDSKIAYVRLTTFARNTARDLSRVINRLEKMGIKGLILDLRFNPGGLLTSAVDISDMFIDDGLIVTIRPRVGREVPYPGETPGSHLSFPMVVLVNGYSASGSEIVAACLQDHKRAIIIGERSYGKGSVQNIQPFEQGELKMTTASFWRPNGKNLNKTSSSKEEDDWGVRPDKGFEVKLGPKERHLLAEQQRDAEIIQRHDVPTPEAKPEFDDPQLKKGLEYLRGQIRMAAKAPTKKAG